MKRISLISNSSIQYYKFDTEISLDFSKNNRIYFHQPFDTTTYNFTLDPLFKVVVDEEMKFYRKQDLIDNNLVVNNKLKDDSNLEGLEEVITYFETSNLKKAIKNYSKKWIPLPYFKDNSINKDVFYPTDWVRLYLDFDEDFKRANIVLAVDTTLAKNSDDKTGPQLSLNPEENIFKIHTDDINISNLLSNPNDGSTLWIDNHLSDVFYNNNDEFKSEQPLKQYLSHYLLLIKWLESLPELPELQLFTDNTKKIPVDLVIDIGNSATCALLFENQSDDTFTFEKVKKLIIQDYSNPETQYNDPFPMNLVFCESNFGGINKDKYHNNKFTVPSFVRIGFEAQHLINNAGTNLNLGYELKTHNSSPKRYLWDKNPSDKEWEFYPTDLKKVKKVYLNGISEQLKIDGSLVKGEVFGSKSMFSRNSLMKFVFLELLIHAYVQINSYTFREDHGNMTIPRTLKRITISCPTGMIQYEQIALREAAEDACKLLNNYVKFYFDSNENKFWFELPEIIPSIKDIAKKLPELEDRKDWIYDEATSCQLVFLYSLLSKKLCGNNYVIDNYFFKSKENIVIGSVDIGAGTTDIMIASYTLNKELKTINIKPDPLYWDSFKLAGDDLLQEIIQQIIIEGSVNSSADEGCTGLIENYAKHKKIDNISERLNGFFGKDSNNIGYVAQVMRKAFVHQVGIPIALYYLKHANMKELKTLRFEDIIGKEFKNKELINYFEKHMGFSFLDIEWTINPVKVNTIVDSVFDSLINQLSRILNQFGCDYIVLSGKPCSLNAMEDMFLKYLSISPNNLVNLNNYWIGKWFPFSDNRGFVQDPKTMVSVGAIIALMAGKINKINDLKINTEIIKQKLVSTAEYIVKSNYNVKDIILTPKKNENTIIVQSFPYQFGYSLYVSKTYPVSNLYTIGIDGDEINKTIRQRFPGKEEAYYSEQVSAEKSRILQNFPLKIMLSRDFDESKEELKVESVEDAEGNEKPNKYFKLNYQTLGNDNGYWLDTCEFVLNARNN